MRDVNCWYLIETLPQETQNQRRAHESRGSAQTEYRGMSYPTHLEGGQRGGVTVERDRLRPGARQPIAVPHQIRRLWLRLRPGTTQRWEGAGSGGSTWQTRYIQNKLIALLKNYFFIISNPAVRNVSRYLVCLLASSRISDAHLADTMIGKAVEHMFETEDGTKNEWRGMVLARAPIMNTWFYITYEKDPVLYMYQLLDDYKDGDLRIMPDSSTFIQCFGLAKF